MESSDILIISLLLETVFRLTKKLRKNKRLKKLLKMNLFIDFNALIECYYLKQIKSNELNY